MLVVSQHDRHRTLHVGQTRVEQRPNGTGRILDVAVHQQDQRVDPLVGHRGPKPRGDLGAHPGEVRLVGYFHHRAACGQRIAHRGRPGLRARPDISVPPSRSPQIVRARRSAGTPIRSAVIGPSEHRAPD